MLICEEYIKRHKIKVPIIQHKSEGNFFIREHGEWHVLLVSWKYPKGSYHPGAFSLRFVKPRHNAFFENAPLFIPISEEMMLYWDEYEEYILGFASRLSKDKIGQNRKQVVLAAWEMFLCICDKFLTSLADPCELYSTIDPDLSLNERYLAFNKFLNVLRSTHPDVYKFWMLNMMRYVVNYSYWLGDLVRKNGQIS